MRLGLFGGTFDPPHVGHLLAASDAVEALALDQVVFIPNAAQPLKSDGPVAPASDRVEMVRLLCGDDPRFTVDDLEVRRGGLSFTVDTLREYRTRPGVSALFLLLGVDAALTLPAWRDSADVQALAEVVVLTRGADEPDGERTLRPELQLRRVNTRRVDVSSTEIRERIRAGRAVTGFVPPAVAALIASRRLYDNDGQTSTREGT